MRMRVKHTATLGLLGVAAWIGCGLQTSGLGPGTGGRSSTTSSSSSSGAGGTSSPSSSSGGPTTSSSSSSSSSSGCTPGTMVDCYTGLIGTEGIGACREGQAACLSDGGVGTCTGEVTPVADNCASFLDQTCNNAPLPTCTGAPGPGGKAWGEGMDQGLAIAVDSTGAVIVGGYFNGMLDFGNGPVMAQGGQDSFVAKYDKTAKLVWMQHFGDMGPQQVNAVAVDAMDNVIVAGGFVGKIAFSSTNMVMGGPGLFVAKLEPTMGNLVWANGYTGGDMNHQPTAFGVAVSPDGTIAVAGQVAGNTMIGSTAVNTSGNGDFDGVVFTLSSTGTVGWVKQINDANKGLQALYGVAIDANDNVVVTGTAAGDVDFGDGTTVMAPGSNNGPQAIAVALYAKDGSITWKQLLGGSALNIGYGVVFGAGGDAFVTGSIEGIVLGGETCEMSPLSDAGTPCVTAGAVCNPTSQTCGLTAQGKNDIFVARFANAVMPVDGGTDGGDGGDGGTDGGTVPGGTLVWVKSFGTVNGDDAGRGIAADAYSVTIGGYFQGTLMAGSAPTITSLLNSYAPVAMKLLADGTVLWAQQPAGGGSGKGMAIALDTSAADPPGSSAIAGWFAGNIEVDGADGGVVGGMDAGMGPGMSSDIFFSRLAP
jgi:hypothetical protein